MSNIVSGVAGVIVAMFDGADTLLADLRAFVLDPRVAAIPFSFGSHQAGACLLQLAAERTPAPLEPQKPDAADFRAARKFLECIVFDATNDYFTLMCVEPNATEEAIKDNYRRLIALVHPDANPIGFPADAASRVNLAYAVLSNAGARASYVKSLDCGLLGSGADAKSPQSVPKARGGGSRSLRPSQARGVFAWLKRPRFGSGLLALAILLVLPVVIILASMANDDSQRLISSGDQSKQQQSATIATPAVRSSPAPRSPTDTTDVAAGREKNSLLMAAKPSNRADAPPQSNDLASSTTNASQLPKRGSEQGIATLSNEPISPSPNAMPATDPVSMKRPLAPVLGDLLDQSLISSTVPDAKFARIPAPQLAMPDPAETASPNASNGVAITATAVRGQAVLTAQNQTMRAARVVDARARDAEDALLRFGSAYERGSIESVRALFASAMPGRSQLIADYQRVFSNTRQRNIRFVQLKHTVEGQRVTTVGQAVVSTVGSDNKNSTQRVFLEIEVGRDENEVRIERMSNYALD